MRRLFGARYFASAEAGKKPFNVLMFGSDEFTKSTLFTLQRHPNYAKIVKRMSIVAPTSKQSPASESLHDLVKQLKIPKYTFRTNFGPVVKYVRDQPEKYEFPFDLAIIAAFPHKLPEKLLNLFPRGVLVAHPSMLPKYKGASPIEHSLLNKESSSGVTILEASKEKVGSGKVILQRECAIEKGEDYVSLATKCGAIAGESLATILDDLDTHLANAKPQTEDPTALKAPLITKQDAILLWDRLDAAQAALKYTALRQSSCPAFTKLLSKGKWHYVYFDKLAEENDMGSEYYRKVLSPASAKAQPGDIHWSNRGMRDKLSIKCKDGWVTAERVWVMGNRSTTVTSFTTVFLNDDHFSAGNEFKHRFALSKDIVKLEEKIEI